VDGARKLVDAVFVLVIVLTLLQGSTLQLLARKLGISRGAESIELEVDVASLDELGPSCCRCGSRRVAVARVYLRELRLPTGATVSLIARRGKGFTPESTTRLQEGDEILVVTTEEVRAATERRIRAVDKAGRYARWRGESGT